MHKSKGTSMTKSIEIEYELKAEDDDDIQAYVKPWVGLTDDEINKFADMLDDDYRFAVFKKIEQLLRDKNI